MFASKTVCALSHGINYAPINQFQVGNTCFVPTLDPIHSHPFQLHLKCEKISPIYEYESTWPFSNMGYGTWSNIITSWKLYFLHISSNLIETCLQTDIQLPKICGSCLVEEVTKHSTQLMANGSKWVEGCGIYHHIIYRC